MNVYDSVRMKDVLTPLGYEESDSYENADLVLLNTCHIREKAAEKVYSEVGRIRREKERMAEDGKYMTIAVAGCVAQAEGEEMLKRTPAIDLVIGSQSYHHLPRLLKEREAGGKRAVELDFPTVQKFDLLPEAANEQGSSAFLSVQEGCDKFCTFCVVPYTRGAEYSRPVATVLDEARRMVEEQGALEITLLGQNVNAYHGENGQGGSASLAELIAGLAEINGLQRIRYTTSHPRDMSDDLIEAHGSIDKLMPYLHLPVQAGSDRILKAMNRKHTAADYIEIIEKLRAVRPDMAFSGDFIVGFPGETEEDFIQTMKVAETVGYASAYSFKYSPRPGTPAADKAAQVPEAEKSKRLELLQGLLNRSRETFNRHTLDKEFDVLLDRQGRHEGQLIGRSPYMQAVHVKNAEHLAGQLVRVRISEVHPNSLGGELIGGTKAAA